MLQGATLQCAYMPRANLEGASLKHCNFDAAYGSKVNLEGSKVLCLAINHVIYVCNNTAGANLKGACLDSSQMNGVNLRLASLKGASMKLCGLRFVDMAGTDLEVCHSCYVVSLCHSYSLFNFSISLRQCLATC